MSLSPDRGSIIVADLALGAMIVLVLAAGASAAGMVIDAGQASREAARSAAVELARGVKVNPAIRRAESLAPADADVDHDVTNGSVRVVVRTIVRLPHPIFLSKRVSLTAKAVVPIAPYRSGG